jgi:Na+/proline symporter
MNSRSIMVASAIVYLANSILFLFASDIVSVFFGLAPNHETQIALQLFGALLLGMGLMNWNARGLVLGGIYGRALVFGNFAHTFSGFLVGLRARLGGFGNEWFWVEVVLYLILACLFGATLFRGPFVEDKEKGGTG